MSSTEIRITDLAHPVFSDLEKQAIASAPPVDMNLERILEMARTATGLSNFGAEDFRDRLAVWLQAFEEDKGLNALGRASVFEMTRGYAIGRLRVEDLIRRHPEILQVKIDRPVLIAGLPRSGTTHLVNILATNPEFRSMPLWEAMEPVPAEGELSFAASVDNPRFKRCIDMWQMLTGVLQYWSAMHESAPERVHEEVELQCFNFSSYIPEWLARVPRWREYYAAHDQTPHYLYARKIVQAMTWMKGPNRWVMKSPPMMESLVPVFSTYPDATVVITHRDPLAVIQSALTMLAYWDRIRRTEADLPGLAESWINRIESLLRACVRDRDAVPRSQVMDVMFHDYMADEGSVVRKVYALAGQPMTPETNRRIEQYLTDNPRGKHGRIVYDLNADFGVDVAALRRRFQFYYDRFPVKQERVTGE